MNRDYKLFSPFDQEITFPFSDAEIDEVKVVIKNIAGKVVLEYNSKIEAGNICFGNGLTRGFFIAKVEGGGVFKVYRIFKN